MDTFINLIVNQGFAIAVAVYLLYERSKINKDIVKTLNKISIIIDERLPKR